jgi:hypothetical protein
VPEEGVFVRETASASAAAAPSMTDQTECLEIRHPGFDLAYGPPHIRGQGLVGGEAAAVFSAPPDQTDEQAFVSLRQAVARAEDHHVPQTRNVIGRIKPAGTPPRVECFADLAAAIVLSRFPGHPVFERAGSGHRRLLKPPASGMFGFSREGGRDQPQREVCQNCASDLLDWQF